MMTNEKKLEQLMLDLGFSEVLQGTDHIRQAVRLWNERPHMQISGEIYPALAAAANASPTQIERRMRHAIERAWQQGNPHTQREVFGWTYSAEMGRPRVGEVVARLARVSREN